MKNVIKASLTILLGAFIFGIAQADPTTTGTIIIENQSTQTQPYTLSTQKAGNIIEGSIKPKERKYFTFDQVLMGFTYKQLIFVQMNNNNQKTGQYVEFDGSFYAIPAHAGKKETGIINQVHCSNNDCNKYFSIGGNTSSVLTFTIHD